MKVSTKHWSNNTEGEKHLPFPLCLIMHKFLVENVYSLSSCLTVNTYKETRAIYVWGKNR